MGDRRQRLDRLENLLCEVLLFVADVTGMVAGMFYYTAIGVTLIAAFYFRRDIAIVHSIELCIGTAATWGLARVAADALEAHQVSRNLGISSTKLQGR